MDELIQYSCSILWQHFHSHFVCVRWGRSLPCSEDDDGEDGYEEEGKDSPHHCPCHSNRVCPLFLRLVWNRTQTDDMKQQTQSHISEQCRNHAAKHLTIQIQEHSNSIHTGNPILILVSLIGLLTNQIHSENDLMWKDLSFAWSNDLYWAAGVNTA